MEDELGVIDGYPFVQENRILEAQRIKSRYLDQPERVGKNIYEDGPEPKTVYHLNYANPFSQNEPQKAFVPKYVELDKKILSFHAYYEEIVHYNESELHRIRPVKISYSLLNDTLSVSEPVTENSGLNQGRIFHQQKVPKTSADVPESEKYWNWRDLGIGKEVEFFSRKYRIVDCDDFTKVLGNHYIFFTFFYITSDYITDGVLALKSKSKRLTIATEVFRSDPQSPCLWKSPANLILRSRTSFTANPEPQETRDSELVAPRCWNSRYVILGVWLDKKGNHFVRTLNREFLVILYSEDESVQIKEMTYDSEAQPSGMHLKRQKLPKQIRQDGNVARESSIVSWYCAEDFRIGKVIGVMGATILIYSCANSATAEFFTKNYGPQSAEPLSVTKYLLENAKIPDEPKAKDSPTLRFLATMNNPPEKFELSRFIVSYNVESRILAINERDELKRGWHCGRAFVQTKCAPEIRIRNFQIKNTIAVYGWKFTLIDADESTRSFISAFPYVQ